MSSLTDAFESPVLFKEHGLDLSLPKLDIDDHVVWCAELHAKRKPANLKLIPGNAPPAERFKMQRAVEYEEPTLDEIADLIYTPAGARDCIVRSLRKSGMGDADAAAMVKRIPAGRLQILAIDVSALFVRKPPPVTPPAPQGGPPNPLPPGQSEAGDAAASTSTGTGPASSSSNTSAVPPAV